MFGKFVGQTPRWVVLKASAGFSLSPRDPSSVAVPLSMDLCSALQSESCRRQAEAALRREERAGVRGKLTLAVGTALALPQKSADRPKGRMALSHSFFHASGFAGIPLLSGPGRS